jgi:hypothetical protein
VTSWSCHSGLLCQKSDMPSAAHKLDQAKMQIRKVITSILLTNGIPLVHALPINAKGKGALTLLCLTAPGAKGLISPLHRSQRGIARLHELRTTKRTSAVNCDWIQKEIEEFSSDPFIDNKRQRGIIGMPFIDETPVLKDNPIATGTIYLLLTRKRGKESR